MAWLAGLCPFGLGHKGSLMATLLEVENSYGSTYHVARTDGWLGTRAPRRLPQRYWQARRWLMPRLKRAEHVLGEGHLGPLFPPRGAWLVCDHTLLFGSDSFSLCSPNCPRTCCDPCVAPRGLG